MSSTVDLYTRRRCYPIWRVVVALTLLTAPCRVRFWTAVERIESCLLQDGRRRTAGSHRSVPLCGTSASILPEGGARAPLAVCTWEVLRYRWRIRNATCYHPIPARECRKRRLTVQYRQRNCKAKKTRNKHSEFSMALVRQNLPPFSAQKCKKWENPRINIKRWPKKGICSFFRPRI